MALLVAPFLFLWNSGDVSILPRKILVHDRRAGVAQLQFSPDGRLFTAGGAGMGKLLLWETTTWEPLASLGIPIGVNARIGKPSGFEFGLVSFSPDSKIMASASGGELVRLWSVASYEVINEINVKNVSTTLFTADGKTLIVSGTSGLEFWDLKKMSVVDTIEEDAHCYQMSLSADGKRIAVRDSEANISVYDVERRKRAFTIKTGEEKEALGLPGNLMAFSPDGKTVVTATKKALKNGKVWDVETGKLLRSLLFYDGSRGSKLLGAASLAFSHDSKVLAQGSGGYVHLWDLESDTVFASFFTGKNRFAETIAFSPDGKMLAVAQGEKTISIFDVPKRKKGSFPKKSD